jgi:HTH-type transcriptional repressor of NAD biosynthesis genes
METLPSPRFRHGLIIGKFRPPHAGHCFLVRAAAACCERLTVGVFDHASARLSLAARADILREELPAALRPRVHVTWAEDPHPVDYKDPAVWEAHVSVFREGLRASLALDAHTPASLPVDALFSSEAYGEELARRLGIPVNVVLDAPRTWQPVSATAVRNDLAGQWHLLPEATRARLALRVVVLGAESTGTTTLARQLAEALASRGGALASTRFVPEFGREHSHAKLAVARAEARAAGRTEPGFDAVGWDSADFVHIARMQTAWEEAAARSGGPVVVCDTDALATSTWHERYMGRPSAEVAALAAALAPRALYVLTDEAGVPFEQDGLRDGEHLRSWMNGRFESVLQTCNAPWLRVRGSPGARLAAALAQVDALLRAPLTF